VQYVRVLGVFLASDSLVGLLATLATPADCFGVRRQLELGRRQILAAAAAVVDVPAQRQCILRHLQNNIN